MITLLWVILVADALLLVLIVLLQSGRGGGLSGMLGGGGGAESALGPKSGLPKITGGMAAVFFITAILMGIMSRDDSAFKLKEAKRSSKAVATSAEPGTATDAAPSTAADAAKPATAADPKPTTGADAAEPGTEPATRTGAATADPAEPRGTP